MDLTEVDDIVSEYLSYRRFYRSLDCFQQERQLGKSERQEIGIVEQVTNALNVKDIDTLIPLWDTYITKTIHSAPDEILLSANIAEFYMHLYCATYSFRNDYLETISSPALAAKTAARSMTIFKRFVETRGKVLIKTPEFQVYKSLFKVAFPPTHPSFAFMFKDSWDVMAKNEVIQFVEKYCLSHPPRLCHLVSQDRTVDIKVKQRDQKLIQISKSINDILRSLENNENIPAEIVRKKREELENALGTMQKQVDENSMFSSGDFSSIDFVSLVNDILYECEHLQSKSNVDKKFSTNIYVVLNAISDLLHIGNVDYNFENARVLVSHDIFGLGAAFFFSIATKVDPEMTTQSNKGFVLRLLQYIIECLLANSGRREVLWNLVSSIFRLILSIAIALNAGSNILNADTCTEIDNDIIQLLPLAQELLLLSTRQSEEIGLSCVQETESRINILVFIVVFAANRSLKLHLIKEGCVEWILMFILKYLQNPPQFLSNDSLQPMDNESKTIILCIGALSVIVDTPEVQRALIVSYHSQSTVLATLKKLLQTLPSYDASSILDMNSITVLTHYLTLKTCISILREPAIIDLLREIDDPNSILTVINNCGEFIMKSRTRVMHLTLQKLLTTTTNCSQPPSKENVHGVDEENVYDTSSCCDPETLEAKFSNFLKELISGKSQPNLSDGTGISQKIQIMAILKKYIA